MFTWLNFINFFFFFCLFLLIIFSNNFFTLILISEMLWIIIYVLSVFYGVSNDELNSYSFTFFILGFAAMEFCSGIMLIIFLKNLNHNLDFSYNLKNNTFFFEKNFVKKFFQKKNW